MQLGRAINSILSSGARVIITTVPDLGLSPFAKSLERSSPGSVKFISELTRHFNEKLRTSIDNLKFDGRNYGLVLAEDIVTAMAKFPSSYGISNTVRGGCAVPLVDCTAQTLNQGGNASSWLWANDIQLSSAAHQVIGAQAVARATNNPF